jgi:hypothetical protein
MVTLFGGRENKMPRDELAGHKVAKHKTDMAYL